jgi:undecaprenyl phosphate N,N'-diacetylbacillosamine 1-phosphate transferase
MLKRFIDIVIGFFTLCFFCPLFFIVVFLLKLETQGPIFYSQTRLGKNGHTFNLLKFRSMTNDKRDESIQITTTNSQVTKVGKVIRRLKIDELPQLINVLLGDMSIVGPRPCLPDLQDSFNDDGKVRLLVRPGLTGIAQISGNIYLSWEERWEYDRQYVENQSLLLDIKIIFKTFLIVFLGEKWGLKK